MSSNIQKSTSTPPWLFYNLLAIIILLPIPLGSNRPWATLFFEAWIFLLTASWLFLLLRHKFKTPQHLKHAWLPLILILAVACLNFFQLLPFNQSEKSLEVLNDFGWNKHSLSPYGTSHYLLKSLSFACLFLLTCALVNSARRLKLVLFTFFISGLFQAAYGSFMTLTGIEKIFFLEKYAYIGKATGTFINRNHFANYLVMCIAAGTALLLMDISKEKSAGFKDSIIKLLRFIMSPKMLLRLGLAIIVIGIVLSQSRMGNTSFFISLTLAGLLWMIFTKRVNKKALTLIASFIIIDLLIVGNWFGFEEVQQRLESTSAATETRDEVIRDTWIYIKDHPIFGTGGGSYKDVYPSYKGIDVNGYYQHAHNDYLQILGEYGVIGATMFALLVLLSLRFAFMSLKRHEEPLFQATGFAVLMTIFALLMHSLVDFNLQIMANAASATIIMALACVSANLRHNQANISKT